MKQRVSGGRPIAWEDAGRQIAPILGSYASAVVVSTDPVAAAHVALGIARAEADHRRATIGDLVGDLPPLRSLIKEDELHGISDTFLYGISLNKVAYPVAGVDNVWVMPSGTEPAIEKQIMASERWKRIAASFAEMHELLLLVARSDAPGLAELADHVDGVVLVRDADLPNAPSALILARVAKPTRTLKLPLRFMAPRGESFREQRWFYPGIGALILIVFAALGALLLSGRITLARRAQPRALAKAVATRSTPPPAAPVETMIIAPPVNVAESAGASAFGVELVAANTPEGANFVLRKNGAALPSATVAPVPIGSERTTWYKVIAGAYTTRYQADSLLSALRKSRLLSDSAGSVVRVPLALLIDSVPTQGGIVDAVRAALQKYIARGFQVYALMQDEGGARIYTGAFERAEQSAELLKTLRGAGLKPVLAYRIGREP